MQTFLPYKSFVRSARCLDNKRLGKQRVEAYQLLNALLGRKHPATARPEKQKKAVAWSNHPAALMWKGHEGSLYQYAHIVCEEWVRRGFKNVAMEENLRALLKDTAPQPWRSVGDPYWLGNRAFHASHRSNLLRKDAAWYGQFGWKELDDLPYVWPVQKESK